MDESELRNSLADLHSASFAWAMTCCRDRELAENVLQSVYVKVLGSQALHEGRSAFRTWLFAVIRNAAHDHRRRRWWSRVVRLEFESLAELPESEANAGVDSDEENELRMIRAAMTGLPRRQREVAHLVFYEELTVAEAAEVMSVSVGTARQHYARAKDSLRVTLQPMWNSRDEATSR
jgi:RNA polymerase sigma factor (sigma-70 family)